ncbi:MAG: ATP-binding cassette domain-containing protein [Chloroflexota bacterium]|nr:ATP-binding cassette domain-containing protein [Chloroflexota bacterium]MDQ5865654.1 ATP-binding cassette domain-containing protein [Chloroflexota bacterium]
MDIAKTNGKVAPSSLEGLHTYPTEARAREQIVITKGLTRRYGAFTAVDGIDLEVRSGEVFGLLGPNGAGKTTTIKMLVTLLPPSAGHAWVGGFDVERQSDNVRRLLGYVPQALSADGNLTGKQNLEVFAKLYDVPRVERRDRIDDALHFMGLSESANKMVSTYSGGMIRRLEIAQTLIHRPRLLFLDEPTIGLDPVARRAVWEHLTTLREQYGTTLFVTTHYMEEAEELCTRIAIMNRGKIVALGMPGTLIEAVGAHDATLEDAFAHFTGDSIESGGTYRDVRQARRTAGRLR